MVQANDPQTYRGNCHCGALVYTAQLPDLKSASICNCSVCTKKGYLWIPLERDLFQVIKGDETSLAVYSFSPRKILHKVCSLVSAIEQTGIPDPMHTVLLSVCYSPLWYIS